ncbi:hypothetical protein [Spiroplasma culicicola]|uniref:Transmembrane protein n=1 Tax=Spiroplasma culicicola AES-1 TaxID=1276246 RepID=W6A8C4_9MOLU|nr:hypothetical protein [Spiroplasma culicicola]AHI53145.1 hypothetical protein SCULI_v1c08050 [Spiroplasma culicicola AES-1]
MYLATWTEVTNTIMTCISTVTIVSASLIIPFLLRRFNDKKMRMESGEKLLADAFDKYFSDEYPKNNFEWYVAEIKSIQIKFDINYVHCKNCNKHCKTDKYMEFFKGYPKNIPELNNFYFTTSRFSFKFEMNVLMCYKCGGKPKVKKIKKEKTN